MGQLRYSLILVLSFFTIHISFAEVRYVSHSGSNSPPYLTWETAADSIMSAINISSFGDTIFVANGVYEEQVVMIRGLSLIGAGMDSCVIDTRALINSADLISIEIKDNCLLKGFNILVYANSSLGWGIAGEGSINSLVELNKISNAEIGIMIDATYYGFTDFTVYKNICNNVFIGMDIFNSNSKIIKNFIYTDIDNSVADIRIGAFNYSYKPVIDSNLIYVTNAYGIYKSFGASPIISNNTILLNVGAAMGLSYTDTAKIYNNLIFGLGNGVDNEGIQFLQFHNNYIGGEIGTALVAGPDNVIENNIITNAVRGIKKWTGYGPPTVKYNCLWDNSSNYSGFTNTDTTNSYRFPMVVNDDSTQGELDFHLQMFSPLIDRGDPAILDKDGSRSDIGLYGGLFGERYQYTDLPPRIPVNLSAAVDSNYIHLKWNKNTEADFNHYNLYRDTTENFTADSATLAASIPDTFYSHIIPPGITDLYYKITAVDNQGNESGPSEELHVFLTGTINNEELTINNYKLFQNYPNPFNPSTKIGYRLKERGYVKLYIYDIKGELVETLVNRYQEAGYYEVEFRGGNSENVPRGGISSVERTQEVGSLRSEVSSLASGVYIYQIMVKNEKNIPVFSDIKKMILLK